MERSELYKPEDSRTATLDLKGRRKPGGSVPMADYDDDRYPRGMDPYGNEQDDVSLSLSNMRTVLCG